MNARNMTWLQPEFQTTPTLCAQTALQQTGVEVNTRNKTWLQPEFQTTPTLCTHTALQQSGVDVNACNQGSNKHQTCVHILLYNTQKWMSMLTWL